MFQLRTLSNYHIELVTFPTLFCGLVSKLIMNEQSQRSRSINAMTTMVYDNERRANFPEMKFFGNEVCICFWLFSNENLLCKVPFDSPRYLWQNTAT